MDPPRPAGANPDRRQRARRSWQVPGLVYCGETVAQVELRDISREVDDGGGVGFVSPVEFQPGQTVYLKVGIGPLRHPRAATIAYSRRRPDGKFWVGATLGGAAAQVA